MKVTIAHNSLAYRFLAFSGKIFIRFIEALLSGFSKEKTAVINSKKWAWVAEIEKQTPTILSELNNIMQSYDEIPRMGDLSKEQRRIIEGQHQWKTFMLYVYGEPIEKNIERCPATSRIVKQIPGMTLAFFSILEPNTSLAPHRGPYKGVLRYHLGLIIPSDANKCGIKIDGKTYHWQVGKSLIFDDTFTHQVWNNTNEKRVVLFVDFKRDLIFPVNILNNKMIKLIRQSPFIANMLKEIENRK